MATDHLWRQKTLLMTVYLRRSSGYQTLEKRLSAEINASRSERKPCTHVPPHQAQISNKFWSYLCLKAFRDCFFFILDLIILFFQNYLTYVILDVDLYFLPSCSIGTLWTLTWTSKRADFVNQIIKVYSKNNQVILIQS